MKLELPGWISAREPNRSRNFMVVKVVLFICLVVEVIETLLYSPIYYKIIEEETKQAPVGEDYNVWIVILSTILSVAFGLTIISIGMYHLYDDYHHLVTHTSFLVGIIGVLKENFILVLLYAIILLIAIIVSLVTFSHQIIVIFSAISNFFVVLFALLFAHLIRKYDKRLR